MPKINDVKAYWKEIAGKSGLDEEKLKQVASLIEDEKFAKTLQDNFKPLPDYSHDLDEVREKGKQEEFKRLETWHNQEKTKFDSYVVAEEKLKKYEAKFGKLEGGDVTVTNREGIPAGLTKEEVAKLLDEQLKATLAQRDQAYMDYLEVRESHMDTFKKKLDVKAFETAWKENKQEWGDNMKIAYEKFVGPEIEKVREADIEARIKQKYDEGVRDGYSRRALPTDSASKTFSPMFDRKEDVAKMTERDQENHSRNAFFEGLREKPA